MLNLENNNNFLEINNNCVQIELNNVLPGHWIYYYLATLFYSTDLGILIFDQYRKRSLAQLVNLVYSGLLIIVPCHRLAIFKKMIKYTFSNISIFVITSHGK